MKKKSGAWVPVFVTKSAGSIRIGLAGQASLPQPFASPWHEFFFGSSANPKQNLKIHSHREGPR